MDLTQALTLIGLPVQAVLIIIIILGHNKFKEQNDKFERNTEKLAEFNKESEKLIKKIDEVEELVKKQTKEASLTEQTTVATFGNGKKDEYWKNKINIKNGTF